LSSGRTARLAAIAIVVGVTGCSHTAQVVPKGPDPVSVSSLTRSAWVDRGFFVDAPWSRDTQVWALDETYWGVRRAGGRPTGLDPQALSRWMVPALQGKLANSSDAPLYQAQYAVTIAEAAGMPFSHSAVAGLAEKLRVRGRYRDGDPGDEPSWSDTVTAQELLHTLHREVPPEVGRSLSRAIADQPGTASVDTIISETSSVLEAYSLLPLSMRTAAPEDVDAVIDLVTRTLDNLSPGPVTLAVQASVSESLKRLGRSAPKTDPRMCAVVTHSGLQPQNQAHLDVRAAELGCRPRTHIEYRAPSVSGWPAPPIGGDVLMESTEAGLALVPPDARRRAAVRSWLRRQQASMRSPDAVDRVAADRLALAVGSRPPFPIPRLPKRSRSSGHTMLVALDADVLRRAPRLRRGSVVEDLRAYVEKLSTSEDLTLIDALALESVGRLLQRSDLRALAHRTALGLRTKTGSFRYAPTERFASVTLNAIGAWITDTTIETRSLEAHRLCAHDVCADSARITPGTASLGATAMLHLCKVRGCEGIVPLFLY
jgi:hypothetical protein